MKSLNSVHFIELDPFHYRKNIDEKFKSLIKDKDIQFLEEVRQLLNKRMKQLTKINLITAKYNQIKLLNGTLQNH